ncbi:MAG: hypothetical protein ACTHN8_16230 [Angustibacter sp.]
MGELLKLGAVLAGLLVVYALVLGGLRGRVGRPPAGIGTRFADPSGEGLAATLLTVLAIGSLTGAASGSTGALSVEGAAALGLLLATLLTLGVTRGATTAALSVLGVVAAVVEGAQFVSGPDAGGLGRLYRISLVLLVIACFGAAALVFHRASAVRGARGLALFALIDIAVFLAGPGGAQLFSLSAGRHLVYLGAACACAFLLGWAVSELTLGLAAIGVAVTTFGLGLVGLAPGAHAGDQLVGVIAALVVFTLVRAGLAALGLRRA